MSTLGNDSENEWQQKLASYISLQITIVMEKGTTFYPSKF